MKKDNFKFSKSRLYHKLINNKLVYDNKPLNRYKNNGDKISQISLKGKDNLLSKITK